MPRTSLRVQIRNQVTTYLKKKGLRILKSNLQTKLGKITVLAEDSQTLVLVELVDRSSNHFRPGAKIISQARQERLLMIARKMQVKYNRQSVRIDVIAVDNKLKTSVIKYYRGIIESHV